MKIDVVAATVEDKLILRNLMQLYQYDFSKFDGADVDAHGLYNYNYLDNYWIEEERFPFLIRVDGAIAGFVLVRKLPPLDGDELHSLAEFFIMRKYRRRGVGHQAAHCIFDRFQTKWYVAQEAENLPSQLFWRRVIGQYTNGEYVEMQRPDDEGQGPMQFFSSNSAENRD